MAANEFAQAQIAVASTIVGSEIVGWDAIEMAVVEQGEGGAPAFAHRDAPCLQLTMLAIVFADGLPLVVSHYQGIYTYGFRFEHREVPFEFTGSEGIFRRRQLDELAIGPVVSVVTRTATDSGDLTEVVLRVGGRDLLLIAGEIQETWTERLHWVWGDESTLVFTDPAEARKLPWVPSRKYDEQSRPL